MPGESSNETKQRLATNLARVDNLVSLYDELIEERGDRRGRPSTVHSDLLRAAVVMLHASLEDVLRSMEMARFLEPGAPHERFKGLKFPSFEVKELLPFRGRSVDDVRVKGKTVDAFIEDTVASYISRSNYNDEAQVCATIERHGLSLVSVRPHVPNLTALISRRHMIAHRADQNILKGRGHHPAQPLASTTVTIWRSTVLSICNAILDQY